MHKRTRPILPSKLTNRTSFPKDATSVHYMWKQATQKAIF